MVHISNLEWGELGLDGMWEGRVIRRVISNRVGFPYWDSDWTLKTPCKFSSAMFINWI